MSAVDDFREPLLRKTVDWCAERSPFYRRRLAPVLSGFEGLRDLPRIPLLFREEAAAHADELRCERTTPACVQYTTGTTGTFFQLYRSADEVRFIQEFFNEIHAGAGASGEPRPMCLALTSAYHGSPTPVPSRPYVIQAGVYDRTQATQARRILEHEYDFPGFDSRVSVLIGGDILVKALTAFLVAEHFDFASCGVRAIVLTGGYVTPARKRLLAGIWNAAVVDRYSLSEIFGGAVERGIGGPWAFDVEVVPEVVHPRTHAVVTKGVGTLVLTSLYPFVQMMPMLRYYTGDLVEIAGGSPGGVADLLVRFVGRERRSIFDASGEAVEPLLLSGPLHEVLESIPDVACSGRFSDIGAGPALELAGKLHYSLGSTIDATTGRGEITLTLGLRYPPWLHRARVTAVCSEVREALYARFPTLRERIVRGDVELRIVPAAGGDVPPFNAK